MKQFLFLLLFSFTSTAYSITINGVEYHFKTNNIDFSTTKAHSSEGSTAEQFVKFTNGITYGQVFENGLLDYTNRVVINNSTKEEVLITGKLFVKLNDVSAKNAQDIATKYDITLTDYFELFKTAFYTPNQQDLFILQDAISKDSLVDSIEIELIEDLAYPN